jgi:hypothetical protein
MNNFENVNNKDLSYYYSLFKGSYENLNRHVSPLFLGTYRNICFLNNMMMINLLDYSNITEEDRNQGTSYVDNNILFNYKKEILYPYNEKLIAGRKKLFLSDKQTSKGNIESRDPRESIYELGAWNDDVTLVTKAQEEKDNLSKTDKNGKFSVKKKEIYPRFYEKRSKGYYKYIKSRDGSLRKRQNSIIQFIE